MPNSVRIAAIACAAALSFPVCAQNTDPALPPASQNTTQPPAVPPFAKDPQGATPSVPAYRGMTQAHVPALPPFAPADLEEHGLGSTYISVDSWVYPAMMRLHALGYIDSAFLSMRPWTRRAALHALQRSEEDILDDRDEESVQTLYALKRELGGEDSTTAHKRGLLSGMETAYVRTMINGGGPVLRDSYHLGQSYINDYGRPYGEGFNTYDGASYLAEWWRFSFHARAEYQGSAKREGYSQALFNQLSLIDQILPASNPRQDTIPLGNTPRENQLRLIDGSVSFHLLDHEISFGKMDSWMGPARGGGMAWSNNADNIYAFRINRVEPWNVPLFFGYHVPLRYDFFVGPLQGHTEPNSPWAHSTMFAFEPTHNLQLSFQRTAVWGGKGHGPITLHTFLGSFFHFDDTTSDLKMSRNDPGARFSSFSAVYRLPFARRKLSFLVDSICHDDVTPISAPRRAAFRTGLYMPQLPGLPRWEARAEAIMTDQSVTPSNFGHFSYYEAIQKQAYTNKGFIMGDWLGREGKGGQFWLTYHLSPNETVEFEYRRKKNAKDFVPLGTTQNTYTVSLQKRLSKELELSASLAYEAWKAPVWKTGQQNLVTGNFQLKFYPKLHSR